MSVYDLMVKRRSVRVFKDQKIPEHIVEKLMDAAHNSPSGGNFQPLSIIIVQEGEGREELGRLFGSQPWVKNAPLLLIFCVDFYRVKKWATLSGADFQGENGPFHFLMAYADLMCAAENVVILSESFGLSSVYIGGIQRIIDNIREYFLIPKLVLPMMLLCIGYPEIVPKSPPKLNRNVIFHNEKYKMLNDDEIQKAYDDIYGEFHEDPEKYFLKAYIEAIEKSYFKSDHWLQLEPEIDSMLKLAKESGIKNFAQFLFKYRYPTEIMASMNKKQIQAFRNAGFNIF